MNLPSSMTLRTLSGVQGGWAILSNGTVIAEACWTPDESAVRIDTDDGVWRARFSGILPLRCTLESPGGQVLLKFAGSMILGAGQLSSGERFTIESRDGIRMGVVWTPHGRKVLEVTHHFGGEIKLRGGWSEICIKESPWPPDIMRAVLYLWPSHYAFLMTRSFIRKLAPPVGTLGMAKRALIRMQRDLSTRKKPRE